MSPDEDMNANFKKIELLQSECLQINLENLTLIILRQSQYD